MKESSRKKLVSLSQDEILGFANEIVSVNVTKLKKYVYYLIGKSRFLL